MNTIAADGKIEVKMCQERLLWGMHLKLMNIIDEHEKGRLYFSQNINKVDKVQPWYGDDLVLLEIRRNGKLDLVRVSPDIETVEDAFEFTNTDEDDLDMIEEK